MDEMPKKGVLTVMVGPPGSGKSTEADRLAKKYGYSIVCPDLIRKELYGDERIQGDSKEVFALAFERVRKLLPETGVIFDATNCRREYRIRLLDETEGYRTMAIACVSTAPLDICLENNDLRWRKVPDYVIRSMYGSLQAETPSCMEGFDLIMRF